MYYIYIIFKRFDSQLYFINQICCTSFIPRSFRTLFTNLSSYRPQKHTHQEHTMSVDHTVKCLTAVALLSCVHSVFWDLYCAAPDRRETCEHSSEAKAFHDYVSELNQPSSPIVYEGAQICTHPPLPHTLACEPDTLRVCILSVIMLLVLVLTCLVCLLQPLVWMGQTEPDVWSSMLLKMQHLWTPLLYFMGKPLDFHLWIF